MRFCNGSVSNHSHVYSKVSQCYHPMTPVHGFGQDGPSPSWERGKVDRHVPCAFRTPSASGCPDRYPSVCFGQQVWLGRGCPVGLDSPTFARSLKMRFSSLSNGFIVFVKAIILSKPSAPEEFTICVISNWLDVLIMFQKPFLARFSFCVFRFKKNLRAFYFVHPTFRSKVNVISSSTQM